MNNQRSINKNSSVLTEKHILVMEDFEQLLDSGIANQTMSDIASRLKVSLRTLYEIAASKEDLIVSTMDRILTNIAIQAVSSIKDISSPLAKLKKFTEIGNEAVGPRTQKFEADLWKIKGAKEMIDYHQDAYINHIKKFLDEAEQKNEIEPIDTQAVALILGGIAREYSDPNNIDKLEHSPESSSNMLTDLIIKGLAKENNNE
ncbi:MAG TPA: TetR/AcrR family transcriptional regulator [Gammaproteobacteria bacterium]|jgi:AcrR family transcriptional regulator|nr:TetR/AcrR family transcriptional regulator [Gammaproteobacteria bacterium]